VSGEEGLIERWFQRGPRRPDVALGIGDDAALLQPAASGLLVACTDTLTEGVHFPEQTPPDAVGHKALAVNLSDVAAMGGTACWALSALTAPRADPAWLGGFADGLLTLASRFGVALVGGDLCRGPTSVTVTVLGTVAPRAALRRDGARPGDGIWVSGTLGDAGLGLAVLQGRAALSGPARRQCVRRLHYPEPRLTLGGRLAGRATAAIDLSDGLMRDLGRLCRASRVGAVIEWERVPCSEALAAWMAHEPEGWRLPLTAGDDYELLFTLPPGEEARLGAELEAGEPPCTRIGTVTEPPGLWLERGGYREIWEAGGGFDHFVEGA